MNMKILAVLLVLCGCSSVADGVYPSRPELVRRVEPTSQWWPLRNELKVVYFPGGYEARVQDVDGGWTWVRITARQYDDVVRWGYKTVAIKNGAGILQNEDDQFIWGKYTPRDMFRDW